MNRIVHLMILMLGLAALPATAGATADLPQAPVLLRAAVIVDDAVIRVADLFDGAQQHAAIAVARAPAPGDSVVLDARWLSAVARAYGLAWRPSSQFEQAVVTRSSQLVGTEAVRGALADSLIARGIDGAYDLQFDGIAPVLKLPVDIAPSLAVQQFNLDSQSGRFSAVVVAPAEGPVAARTVVAGRIFTLTEVPVPVRRLLPGEVIVDSDIQWVEVHADRVGTAIVLDPAQMVGRTPRRPIRAGEPVRANDLEVATMIKKGAMVTMVLESPQMLITTQGRAMESGAAGDLVRVMNTTSNRIIQAIVLDPTTVSVVAAMAPLSN